MGAKTHLEHEPGPFSRYTECGLELRRVGGFRHIHLTTCKTCLKTRLAQNKKEYKTLNTRLRDLR